MTTDTPETTQVPQAQPEGHITREVSANFIEKLIEDAELARARAEKSPVSSQHEEVCHDRTQEEE